MRTTGLLALLFACACSSQALPSDVVRDTAKALDPAKVVDQYITRTFEELPQMARQAGLHDYDGKVSEVSVAAAERLLARAKVYVETVDAFDLDALEDPIRLDLELTRLHAKQVVFAIEERKLHRQIMSYTSLFNGSSYLSRDYAPLPQRVSALLDHLEAATKQVDGVVSILDESQVTTHLETSLKVFGGYREYYEGDVVKQATPALQKDAALKERFDRVVFAALAAVDRLIQWVKDHQTKGTDDYALGAERFLRMLQVNEGLTMSLPELEAMAQANYQLNFDAFVKTAKKIDSKKSVQEVAALVAADRLKKDEVLSTATKQLDALLAFINANDIITIGSEQRATVEVTPPFMRWNSAFLDMAGPFEQAEGSFYYISPPDPSWPAEMQEAYVPYEGDLLATSIHEVYPGHFVQLLQYRRAKSKAQKIFDSYAFVEGWAHYTEQMMLDEGFGGEDPRLRLGQLSNALLRNCRFLAAIGLHTKGMTVAQADQLFKDKCLIDPGNAIQQAYRGTFDPGYLSYTLGKLQILELRAKYFAKHGNDLKKFHDWLLSFGGTPVALIARRL